MQVIYVDILFLINFCLDYLVLHLAGKILQLKIRPSRLAISAALGAVYAVVTVCLALNGALSLVIHIAVSLLMCYTAFSITKLATFGKLIVLFYVISFLFGGGMSAIYSLAQRLWTSTGMPNFMRGGISPFSFIITAAAIFFVVLCAGSLFAKNNATKKIEAEVHLKGKTYTFTLLCDSGNLLRDPYSSLPVVLVKSKLLDGVLPPFLFTDSPCQKAADSMETRRDLVDLKIRLIPIQTAGGRAVVPAIRPDKFYLVDHKGKTEVSAIVAAESDPACDFDGADGVLPSVLLEAI